MIFNDLNAQQYEDLALRCFNDSSLREEFLKLYIDDFEDFRANYLENMPLNQVSTMFLEWHDDEFIEFGFNKYKQEYVWLHGIELLNT